MSAQRAPLSAMAEAALGALVLALAGYQLWFVYENGYLSQPFFYDTNDTLMDFYNTAYWSHTDGPYSVWNSIYPPISFALLKFTTLPQCYLEDGFRGRECDPYSWLMLAAAAGLLCAYVGRKAWQAGASGWAVFGRVSALAVGLPTLYGLERGNLLVLAAPFMVYGLVHARVGWRAATALAIAINLKPYLVLLALPVAVAHGPRGAGRLITASAVVYLLSIVVVGDGLPWEILSNLGAFTGEGLINYWEKFYFSTSFSPFIRILESDLPLDQYLDSQHITLLLQIMRGLILACAAGLLLAYGAALAMPADQRPRALLSALTLCFALVLTESFGGYAVMLVTALLFTQRLDRPGLVAAMVLCFLLSLPYDHIVAVVRESEAPIWVTGREVQTEYGVALGQGLRPAVIGLLQLVLCGAVVAAGWSDVCQRWRGLGRQLPRSNGLATPLFVGPVPGTKPHES